MSDESTNQSDQDKVWMACRATPDCEGKMARLVFKVEQPFTEGGGTSFRYRCTTCNGVWHITH